MTVNYYIHTLWGMKTATKSRLIQPLLRGFNNKEIEEHHFHIPYLSKLDQKMMAKLVAPLEMPAQI